VNLWTGVGEGSVIIEIRLRAGYPGFNSRLGQ
jgi:hypothetical protein